MGYYLPQYLRTEAQTKDKLKLKAIAADFIPYDFEESTFGRFSFRLRVGHRRMFYQYWLYPDGYLQQIHGIERDR